MVEYIKTLSIDIDNIRKDLQPNTNGTLVLQQCYNNLATILKNADSPRLAIMDKIMDEIMDKIRTEPKFYTDPEMKMGLSPDQFES